MGRKKVQGGKRRCKGGGEKGACVGLEWEVQDVVWGGKRVGGDIKVRDT